MYGPPPPIGSSPAPPVARGAGSNVPSASSLGRGPTSPTWLHIARGYLIPPGHPCLAAVEPLPDRSTPAGFFGLLELCKFCRVFTVLLHGGENRAKYQSKGRTSTFIARTLPQIKRLEWSQRPSLRLTFAIVSDHCAVAAACGPRHIPRYLTLPTTHFNSGRVGHAGGSVAHGPNSQRQLLSQFTRTHETAWNSSIQNSALRRSATEASPRTVSSANAITLACDRFDRGIPLHAVSCSMARSHGSTTMLNRNGEWTPLRHPSVDSECVQPPQREDNLPPESSRCPFHWIKCLHPFQEGASGLPSGHHLAKPVPRHSVVCFLKVQEQPHCGLPLLTKDSPRVLHHPYMFSRTSA